MVHDPPDLCLSNEGAKGGIAAPLKGSEQTRGSLFTPVAA